MAAKEAAFRRACVALALGTDPQGATKWLEGFRHDVDVLTVTKSVIETADDATTSLAVQTLRDVILLQWSGLGEATLVTARDLLWRTAMIRRLPSAASAFAKVWKRSNKLNTWDAATLFSPAFLGQTWQGPVASVGRLVVSEFAGVSMLPLVTASFETEALDWWRTTCGPLVAAAVMQALTSDDALEAAIDLDDLLRVDEGLVVAVCAQARSHPASLRLLRCLARRSPLVAHIALPRLAIAMSSELTEVGPIAACMCDVAFTAALTQQSIMALGQTGLEAAALATEALLRHDVDAVTPALELWALTSLDDPDAAVCRHYCGQLYLRYAEKFLLHRPVARDDDNLGDAEDNERRALAAAVGRRGAPQTFSQVAEALARVTTPETPGFVNLATDLATDEESTPELPPGCTTDHLLDAVFRLIDLEQHDERSLAGALGPCIARWLANIDDDAVEVPSARISLTLAAATTWLTLWPLDRAVVRGVVGMLRGLARVNRGLLAAELFDATNGGLSLATFVGNNLRGGGGGGLPLLFADVVGAVTDICLVVRAHGRADLIDTIAGPLLEAVETGAVIVDIVGALCRSTAVHRVSRQAPTATLCAQCLVPRDRPWPLVTQQGALAAFRDLVSRQLPFADPATLGEVIHAAPAFVRTALSSDDDVVAALDIADGLLGPDIDDTAAKEAATSILVETIPLLGELLRFDDVARSCFAALHSLALAGGSFATIPAGLLDVGLALDDVDAARAAQATVCHLAVSYPGLLTPSTLAAHLRPLLASRSEPDAGADAAETAFCLIHVLLVRHTDVARCLFNSDTHPSFCVQGYDRFLIDLRRLFDVAQNCGRTSRRHRTAFQPDFLAFLTTTRSYLVPVWR